MGDSGNVLIVLVVGPLASKKPSTTTRTTTITAKRGNSVIVLVLGPLVVKPRTKDDDSLTPPVGAVSPGGNQQRHVIALLRIHDAKSERDLVEK
jgi:hypothetical protein